MDTVVTPTHRIIFYGSERSVYAEQLAQHLPDLYLEPKILPGATVLIGQTQTSREEVHELIQSVDSQGRGHIAITPEVPVRLVAFDVDSTLVNGEVIDMIAAHQGVGDQVAAITQSAMEGNLDFSASLAKRVALLEGCPIEVLDQIHASLPLNPYAKELIGLLHDAGIATMMVSGGFTHVTTPLGEELGMVAVHANQLEVADGLLTGKVIGEVITGEAKRRHVLVQCEALGIDPAQACAVGDGANDLLMMDAVATGIAYNAKPIVQAKATIALNEGPMTIIAALLGL